MLNSMGPWMGGGEMIQDVFLDRSSYAEPPLRFEAGTPAIAEAIGLGAACDYLSGIGMARVQQAEEQLGSYLYEQVVRVPSSGLVFAYSLVGSQSWDCAQTAGTDAAAASACTFGPLAPTGSSW